MIVKVDETKKTKNINDIFSLYPKEGVFINSWYLPTLLTQFSGERE